MQFPWPRLIRIPAFIVGVVWAIFPSLASSQKSAKEILALPEPERFNALWDWGALEPLGDTTSIENHLRQLEEDFRKLKEPYYMKQAWLMQAVYKPIRVHYYREYGIQLMNTYIEDARDRGWQDMEAECILRKGLMCYAQGRFEAAFEFIQKGYELLKKTGLTNSPFILHHLEHIGNSYYEFGDMPGAIYFLQEAIGLPNKADEPGSRRRIFNTLALCYQQMEQYDSAIHYYTLSYEGSVAAKDTFWAALANGNKGYVYYLHGQYDEAIPLMETDFEQSIRYKVWPSAANAAMGLATMFLTKGNLEKTQYYLDFAGKNINYWNLRDVSGYYKNLAAISRLKGNYDDAFRFIDSSQLYKDKYAREKNIKTINQAKLKVEVEHHANQVKLLEAARSRQVLMRNGLLIILLLTGLAIWLFIRQQRHSRIKERQMAAMRQQSAEAELESARSQLNVFTNALREKTELVESFKQEIEILQHQTEDQTSHRVEQIQTLLNATILTEEDWKEFRQMFDKVHPGFFVRLKEKFNDLSPAETRLLALTKLQLAPKEMAAMLGISYDAIKKSRQRLRRKIDLPEEGGLDELVEMI